MFSLLGCHQHFRISETPHIVSVTIQNNGSGYTHAKAKCVPRHGAELQCKVQGGIITEIKIVRAGKGFTTVPTITIEGDGSGATATVTIGPDYLEQFQNRTITPNWRNSANNGGHNCCPPLTVGGANTDCPPYLGYGQADPITAIPDIGATECVSSCDCFGVYVLPLPVTNNWAAYDPKVFKDYSSCVKRGFKVVFAAAPWIGFRGPDDTGFCKPLTQTKFLSEKYRHEYYTHDHIGAPYESENTYYYEHIHLLSADGNPYIAQPADTGNVLNGLGLPDEFAASITPSCTPIPNRTIVCDYSHDTITSRRTIEQVTSGALLNLILTEEFSDTDSPLIGYVHRETFTYTYTEPNTAGNVNTMAEDLLTYWDLCSDVLIPWRTDGDVSKGPLVTYGELVPSETVVDGVTVVTHNWGIKGAPTDLKSEKYWAADFVNQSYRTSTTNPSAPCCWRTDSFGRWMYDHKTWEMPDFVHVGVSCVDTGKARIPNGANSFYNAPYFLNPCETDEALFANLLVKSKWAETYLFEFPTHNEARPCGADRLTRDPDTIDCVETVMGVANPGYNTIGNYQFSDVPCYCDNPDQSHIAPPADCPPIANPHTHNPLNSTIKKGSYSVKQIHFAPLRQYNFLGTEDVAASCACSAAAVTRTVCKTPANILNGKQDMSLMNCAAYEMPCSPCSPSAIFIQNTALTGKYLTASIYHPVTNPYPTVKRLSCPDAIQLVDDTLDYGVSHFGEWTLVQVQQARIDPLWKRPASCVDGVKVEDNIALPPLEENDDCACDGEDCPCANYVAWLDAGSPSPETHLSYAKCGHSENLYPWERPCSDC